MSYFDDASLVMIPSGYKTSKVYSVKPTDGTGDLTFTRSNDTATRVGPDGLIEKVRTNIYPKNIGLLSGYTLGANASDGGQVMGPTGLMDARRIVMSVASNAFVNLSMTLPAAGQYTFSVWVKLVSGTPLNSPVQYSGLGVNVFMNALPTSTWTRVYGTVTVPSAGVFTLVHPFYDSVATIDYAQVQIETGDIATDYIATTTAAVSVGPVANVPRLDYLNSSCPRLLLEGQRTNVLTYSEQLGNAVWSKYLTTITENNIVSPSGYQDADLATSTAGGDLKNILTLATSTTYTASFYVKKGTAANAQYRVYNFDAGINVVPATSYISQTSTSTWSRVSFTFTTGATGTSYGIYLLENTSAGTMYFWGAQLEAGAYATSYIPTLGAAVTRGADNASKTSASAIIGQTEGTMFWEFERGAAGFDYFQLNGGSASNWILLGIDGSNFLAFINNGGVNQVNILTSLPSGIHKAAFAYKNNDCVLYLDGVQIGTDTSASIPATSVIRLGGPDTSSAREIPAYTSQAILFPTRLQNSDLAALTA